MAPHKRVTHGVAALYVLSGISQPLIMTLCKDAGLADSKSQLYMFFYYLGPSLLIFSLHQDKDAPFPSRQAVTKACFIAIFDIFAQALNYTGAGLAGATIFAVIYSSVTIWTAVFSRIFLDRSVNWIQWVAIFTVCGGLVLTTTDSINLGRDVAKGAILVLLGSAMHASVYVLSESLMTGEDTLTVRQNAAIQSLAAIVVSGFWQVVYTAPRFEALILAPARVAGTTFTQASVIMLSFAAANLLHSVTFYHTLKHYPGGSTSAGVMKGLQAVMVFVAAHLMYCGRVGGEEMCFTTSKFVALLTVASGVTLFSAANKDDRHDTDRESTEVTPLVVRKDVRDLEAV